MTFGNTVQLGIPVVIALLGDTGLAVHVAIISMHALTLLTIATVLVEADLARAADPDHERPSLAATALTTARRAVVHPVVLPALLGLAWNLAGLPLPSRSTTSCRFSSRRSCRCA